MSEVEKPGCPECAGEFELPGVVDRRRFIRVVGGQTAGLLALGGLSGSARAAAPPARKKPGEDLVRELYSGLSAAQKKRVVLAWDHKRPGGRPTRLGMYNAPIGGVKIGSVYTKAQQDLLGRIIKSICSGE